MGRARFAFTFYGPKRVNGPGIAFDALPPIDVVLVSHGHYDHLDAATLSRLAARDNPRVVTPLGNDVIMKWHDPAIRAEGRDWGDRVELGNGVAVTLAPMRHWTARGLTDRNKALWAAFILETPAAASIASAIPATAAGIISAPRASVTVRSVSPSCRSAPTSRAGSCATST